MSGSTLADVQASIPMAQAAYQRAMTEWQASQQENDSPVTSVQTSQPAVSSTTQIGSPVAQPQPTQPNPAVARQAPQLNRAGNIGGMARPRSAQQPPKGWTRPAKSPGTTATARATN